MLRHIWLKRCLRRARIVCSDADGIVQVRDAAVAVPRAMFWSFIMNGILGLGLVVSVLFSIPSLSDALHDPSGYPFIYVFREAMGTTGVNALTAVILVLVFASNVSYNASTARETWAFGRDDGLPFGKWIAHVGYPEQRSSHAVLMASRFTPSFASRCAPLPFRASSPAFWRCSTWGPTSPSTPSFPLTPAPS